MGVRPNFDAAFLRHSRREVGNAVMITTEAGHLSHNAQRFDVVDLQNQKLNLLLQVSLALLKTLEL
jgi:hypothetical protein